MKQSLESLLDQPAALEQRYRENKAAFKQEFMKLYPEVHSLPIAQVWHERLNYQEEIQWGKSSEFITVIFLALMAGTVAKIPDYFGVQPNWFFPRYISFIVFPALAYYFFSKGKIETKRFALLGISMGVLALFMNFLPDNPDSDTFQLACMHLPLLMWALAGYAFVAANQNAVGARVSYLRFNGELIVMSAVMVLAGGLLSGVTIGLFQLIGLNIEEFYAKYVIIYGASAIPIVGTYLVSVNPQLVNKVSPIIAKVFTPLVLVMLFIYLCAVVYTGKDPYNDREFLLLFNALLIGVTAIIFFAVSEGQYQKASSGMLFGLATLSIMVNAIALSAIAFRIGAYGITPNRLAVLGSNFLLFINLMLVCINLWKQIRTNSNSESIEGSIARFLPIYTLWTFIVVVLFPLLFGFK